MASMSQQVAAESDTMGLQSPQEHPTPTSSISIISVEETVSHEAQRAPPAQINSLPERHEGSALLTGSVPSKPAGASSSHRRGPPIRMTAMHRIPSDQQLFRSKDSIWSRGDAADSPMSSSSTPTKKNVRSGSLFKGWWTPSGSGHLHEDDIASPTAQHIKSSSTRNDPQKEGGLLLRPPSTNEQLPSPKRNSAPIEDNTIQTTSEAVSNVYKPQGKVSNQDQAHPSQSTIPTQTPEKEEKLPDNGTTSEETDTVQLKSLGPPQPPQKPSVPLSKETANIKHPNLNLMPSNLGVAPTNQSHSSITSEDLLVLKQQVAELELQVNIVHRQLSEEREAHNITRDTVKGISNEQGPGASGVSLLLHRQTADRLADTERQLEQEKLASFHARQLLRELKGKGLSISDVRRLVKRTRAHENKNADPASPIAGTLDTQNLCSEGNEHAQLVLLQQSETRLQDMVKELQSSNAMLVQHTQKMEIERMALETQLSGLTPLLERVADAETFAQQAQSTLKEQRAAREREQSTFKESLLEANASIENLKKMTADQEEQNSTINSKLQHVQVSNQMFQQRIQEMEHEVDKLTSDLLVARDTVGEHQRQLVREESERETLQQRLAAEQSLTTQLQGQVLAEEANVARLSSEVEDRQNQVQRASDEIVQLQQTIKVALKARLDAESNVSELREEVLQGRIALEKSQDRFDDAQGCLKQKEKECENLNSELARLRDESATSLATLKASMEEYQASEKSKSDAAMMSVLDTMQKEKAAKDSLQTALDIATAKLSAAESECQNALNTISDMRNKETTRLSRMVSFAVQTVETTDSSEKEARSMVKELLADIDVLQQRCKVLEKRALSSEDEASMLRQQIRSVNAIHKLQAPVKSSDPNTEQQYMARSRMQDSERKSGAGSKVSLSETLPSNSSEPASDNLGCAKHAADNTNPQRMQSVSATAVNRKQAETVSPAALEQLGLGEFVFGNISESAQPKSIPEESSESQKKVSIRVSSSNEQLSSSNVQSKVRLSEQSQAPQQNSTVSTSEDAATPSLLNRAAVSQHEKQIVHNIHTSLERYVEEQSMLATPQTTSRSLGVGSSAEFASAHYSSVKDTLPQRVPVNSAMPTPREQCFALLDAADLPKPSFPPIGSFSQDISSSSEKKGASLHSSKLPSGDSSPRVQEMASGSSGFGQQDNSGASKSLKLNLKDLPIVSQSSELLDRPQLSPRNRIGGSIPSSPPSVIRADIDVKSGFKLNSDAANAFYADQAKKTRQEVSVQSLAARASDANNATSLPRTAHVEGAAGEEPFLITADCQRGTKIIRTSEEKASTNVDAKPAALPDSADNLELSSRPGEITKQTKPVLPSDFAPMPLDLHFMQKHSKPSDESAVMSSNNVKQQASGIPPKNTKNADGQKPVVAPQKSTFKSPEPQSSEQGSPTQRKLGATEGFDSTTPMYASQRFQSNPAETLSRLTPGMRGAWDMLVSLDKDSKISSMPSDNDRVVGKVSAEVMQPVQMVANRGHMRKGPINNSYANGHLSSESVPYVGFQAGTSQERRRNQVYFDGHYHSPSNGNPAAQQPEESWRKSIVGNESLM